MPSSSSSKHAIITLLSLLLCFSCSPSSCLADRSLQFSFPVFQPNEPSLTFSQNANVDNQALQVTRNSGSSDVSNTSGQITSVRTLPLWDKASGETASFNTSFLINMGPIMGPIMDGGTNFTGGGMAFILSSVSATRVPDSSGQWLGLFDGGVSSSEQQAKLVAVEIDTFKDSFDPDDNHVGIDVNGSVHSIYTKSLSPDVTLDDFNVTDGTNTSVWIDYDGRNHLLDVYLANQGHAKPANPAISRYHIDLSAYLPETVFVGFSASTGTILESHCVLNWTFTSSGLPSSTTSLAAIVGGSIAGVVVALAVASAVVLLVLRRRSIWDHSVLEGLEDFNYGPRKFSYRELKKATKGFSEECKLGQGGFGSVYMGTLRAKNGISKNLAVKCLSQVSKQGASEFKAEVMSMGRMKHRNLVPLLGWSYARWSWSRRLMLVYEYMPNRSLDQWIARGRENADVMDWKLRYHVMKGLAAGLLYLHEEWEMVVVHRDLKPSNVMLDAEFNARLGDFGLAKLIDYEQDFMHTATIAGTPGYIAPECLDQGIVSKESDVYSFGAIVIELATGRRLSIEYFHSLSILLQKSCLKEAADPRLTFYDATQLELVLKLGLACSHPYPSARPTIREVSHALSSLSISFDMPSMPSATVLTSSISMGDPLTTSSIVPVDIKTGR